MRSAYSSVLAIAVIWFALPLTPAQAQDDASRAIADGGIFVADWKGKIDASEEAKGLVLNNAKFSQNGSALHFTTGPAVAYWNPANTASGNYTVKAKFQEPKYMNLNNHSHPYGIFIGGNDLGTDQQTYLYCAAYGSGNFIVRGFGPAPFQVNGPRGTPNAAINKAAAPGEPVTQEIAVSVGADKIECAINGVVVGSYDKSSIVMAGKLKSTDGVYGLRFGHNTEGLVTDLTMTRQ
jgi:hypothetical protein